MQGERKGDGGRHVRACQRACVRACVRARGSSTGCGERAALLTWAAHRRLPLSKQEWKLSTPAPPPRPPPLPAFALPPCTLLFALPGWGCGPWCERSEMSGRCSDSICDEEDAAREAALV